MGLKENKKDSQTISEHIEQPLDDLEREETIDAVEEELAEVSTEDPCAELESRYVRLMADFDNHKKRTQKEKDDIYKYANQSLVESLLPILDAFELAMKSLPEDAEEAFKGFGDGVSNIQRQLNEVLEKSGLTRIDAYGEPYDPVYHEAVMMVPDSEVPPHTIIDELRAGYRFKDRVIRPTVCRVSE